MERIFIFPKCGNQHVRQNLHIAGMGRWPAADGAVVIEETFGHFLKRGLAALPFILLHGVIPLGDAVGQVTGDVARLLDSELAILADSLAT
jgi:hypothetical protein